MAGFFWGLSLESLLDRESYTLEEVLDEDNVIQGCKCSNSRLLNFLEGREQVKKMVDYVTTMPPEGPDNQGRFKYAFVSCAVLTSEVNGIMKTLVEDEELMTSLFSFLQPDHERSVVLAGYFSKVIICLLLRKTEEVMHYIENHRDVLKEMVDLVGLIAIMEVLMRLVGADDQIYTFHSEAVQWLAETDLLEMLVDKLCSENLTEDHANAASTLCAVTRLPQSPLALKLSSPRFVKKLVDQALHDGSTKSTLVNSLSVCISILDPRRSTPGRVQSAGDQLPTVNPDVIVCMVESLGEFLKMLDVSHDETVLPTTYGELRPPFGGHRLKIVEFVAVLLRADTDKTGKALMEFKGLQLLLDLFFDYPFNNMLHHQVENILLTCVESNNSTLIDHLFVDCDLVGRLLAGDSNPYASETRTKKRKDNQPLRVGNIGHITRIANKLMHMENQQLQTHFKENSAWSAWKSTVLQNRNAVENVYQWACGRPEPMQNRPMDSDEDDFRDRDYDVSAMANSLTREVFRYGMFENDDAEEDVFFDEESAEVVINSLRLSDEQESARLFGVNSWFSFQNEGSRSLDLGSSPPRNEEGHISYSLGSSGSSSSDDEVVVGEDEELADTATSSANLSGTPLEYTGRENGIASRKQETEEENLVDITSDLEAVDLVGSLEPKEVDEDEGSCQFDGGTQPPSKGADQVMVFEMDIDTDMRNGPVETDTEIIKHVKQLAGAEPEATTKAVEDALRSEPGALETPAKTTTTTTTPMPTPTTTSAKETQDSVTTADVGEFNDVNYWRSEYDHSVAET